MRITLFLALAALVVGCGGDNPYDQQQNASGDQAANASNGGAAPANAPPQKPPMSPEAKDLMMAARAANGAPDSKKSALEKLPAWEGRDLPADASYYYGLLQRFAENHDKAVAAFEKFLRAAPQDDNRKTGLYYVVDELIKVGRLDEAEKYAAQLEQEFTDPEGAKYARALESALAQEYMKAGNFEKSTAHNQKAFELGSYYAGEEYVMGLWAQGKYDDARAAAAKLSDRADGQKDLERAAHFVSLAEKMGKPAPKLDVERWVNPEDFSTDRLAGKVVLVYFWTTGNIRASQSTEKVVKPIYEKYGGDDVAVIGLSQHDHFNIVESKKDEAMGTEEEVQNLRNWVFNIKTPWTLGLCANDDLRKAFGYAGIMPTFALIGKDGKYRFYRQGSDPAGFQQVDALVGKLIKE